MSHVEFLSPHLFRYKDTCWVYGILHPSLPTAVLVDFGSGAVLDSLPSLRVERVTDVIITHHHRDQCQGLALAAQHNARIWVPETEQDFFHSADQVWQSRDLMMNYNMRQDRFSLLEPVPSARPILDYANYALGGYTFTILPTPGHTTGSITLLVAVDGLQVAFTGDLIAGRGKLWSLAATQWSYNGGEGLPLTAASLLDLKARQPDLLLPSHGEPMPDPAAAVDETVSRLAELIRLRCQNPRLFHLIHQPYEAITPHLLRNRTSMAVSYVLLSESGKALLIDFGYDFIGGIAPGADRASRRPWLYTLPALKRGWGVTSIEAVIPTHFHDDHVAGINLLRRVEGAQVWAAENFAAILERLTAFDLPCLWHDPIPVDRRLPLSQPISWQEYSLTLHPLPGHTRYAVAVELTVDGRRVLFTGDQYRGDAGLLTNYVYQNHFDPGDYCRAARLYARLQPDLILSGHWEPLEVRPGYFEELTASAAALERLHRELLPEITAGMGPEGFEAALLPYQACAQPGEPITAALHLRNPTPQPAEIRAQLVTPPGWICQPASQSARIESLGDGTLNFTLQTPPGLRARRARVAADILINGEKWGQLAEMLVTID